MKFIIKIELFIVAILIFAMPTFHAQAFTCSQNGGAFFQYGDREIYITVKPEVGPAENIVFDSGNQIRCWNDANFGIDWLIVMFGTKLSGSLSSIYNAKIIGVGSSNAPTMISIPLPVTQDTFLQGWSGTNRESNLSLKAVLSPVGVASGVVVRKGDLIAIYKLRKEFHAPGNNLNPRYFTWRVFSDNDVVIPVGGCDVNSRNIQIDMGDYPNNTSVKDVGLSIKCGKNRSLKISLHGQSEPGSNSIFSNISRNSPSSGVGIELLRNQSPMEINKEISIGNVGNNFTSLNMKARYTLTGKPLKAGNFQATIGVNFTYN